MIYSAWPAFLYTYPAIGRYLLEPVLAYQAASSIQGGYSIHDIGKFIRSLTCITIPLTIHPGALYPNVTGPSSGKSPAAQL